MERDEVARLNEAADGEVTRAMVGFLRGLMKQPEVDAAVERVKNVRDKRIAHNEAPHEVKGPTWKAVLDLLRLAHEIVGLVGWTYLRRAYVASGDYRLSFEARRPAQAVLRLLRRLEIVEERRRGPPPATF